MRARRETSEFLSSLGVYYCSLDAVLISVTEESNAVLYSFIPMNQREISIVNCPTVMSGSTSSVGIMLGRYKGPSTEK
jgi:hypothetical protein